MEKYVNNNVEKYVEIFDKSISEDGSHILRIYTTPRPKQRPRFTANGRHTYTPKETLEYEKLIATIWQLAFKRKCFTGYIRLECRFYMPIPKSWTKQKQEEARSGSLRPSNKNTSDLDNLVKAIQDGLNEKAYWDDAQIVELQAEQWYSDTARVEIVITEIA